jgi:hypothetical protein
MIKRHYYRLSRWVRAVISEALTFIRERYLLVEGVLRNISTPLLGDRRVSETESRFRQYEARV